MIGKLLEAAWAALCAVASALLWFFRWLVADIEDALRTPQRGVVRVICGLLILWLGLYLGIRHANEKQELRAAGANSRVIAANAKEDKLAAEEETARKQAVADAKPVLAKTQCPAPADLAAALNKIR